MSLVLTNNENKLLAQLIASFKTKSKLSDEHKLILGLSEKSSLTDSDVKKLKLLLASEKSKIVSRENRRKAKAAVKLDQQERQDYIENRYKRFGIIFINELKKLSGQSTDIGLSDFIQAMRDNKDFQESDKKWLSSFIVESTESITSSQIEANSDMHKNF